MSQFTDNDNSNYNFNSSPDIIKSSPDIIFSSNESIQENTNCYELQNIFEEVSNNLRKHYSLRQCRCWNIPNNIHTLQPGQYCIIPTDGGDYCTEWYYYKTLNGRHMLIFSTLNTTTFERSYTGRDIPDVPINNKR